MADLTEVGKQLLWIIFAEEVCHIGVFEIARPCTRGHGQGLQDRGGHGSGRGHRCDQERFPGYCWGESSNWISSPFQPLVNEQIWKHPENVSKFLLFTEDIIKSKQFPFNILLNGSTEGWLLLKDPPFGLNLDHGWCEVSVFHFSWSRKPN